MNNPIRNFPVGRILFIFLAVGLLSVGCASTEEKPAPTPEPQAALPEPPAVPTAPEKRVMFDFDSSLIKPGYDEEIKAHIAYLQANAAAKVTIEGHSDSNGPAEYNVGLGAKRAKTVQALMLENGIDAARISVVSHGEEKPLAEGENRQAWSQNRRVEFVYGQ
jgi:peptidoglycan-associated lipoprotein